MKGEEMGQPGKVRAPQTTAEHENHKPGRYGGPTVGKGGGAKTVVLGVRETSRERMARILGGSSR